MLADRVRTVRMGSGKFKSYLYKWGQFSDMWEVGLSKYESDKRKGVASKQSDHLLTETYSDYPGSYSATFGTVNKIDLTNIDTITMLCEKSKQNYETILAIQNDKTSTSTVKKVEVPYIPYTPDTNTVTLDVSSIVGEYYVTVGIIWGSGYLNLYTKIYEVVLE